MVIKCKMCGGDIEFIPGATYGTCEYCGSTSTIPKADDEQKLNRYNRANHYRRQCEFDKAVAAYEKILEQDDTDAEAHWGAVLSRFGIEYVEDPATGKRIPTCHRVQVASILTDDDYLAALKYAPDAESRRLYEEQAAQIADIQKNILAISANEKPYDVFICYKETDEDGQRTRDSQWAQEVYYGLTEQGYKVFFSRITLEDKLGQQYEPYIFAALNSAKVMVVIGSKPEYFNAVWVKNEWSRYLALMKNDRKRLLIPCYRGMDPYDLPEELSNLQSQDMSKIGFMQDLLRGIQKVLSAEKQPEQPKVIIQQAAAPAAPVMDANLTALIKRGNMALVDHEWRKADEFFEKALNLDAENAEAYMGKFLAEQRAETIEAWTKAYWEDAQDRRTEAEELVLLPTKEEKERLAQMVEQFSIPDYLSAYEIEGGYRVDRRYQSFVSTWEEELPMLKNALTNKQFVRALQFAQGDLKARYDAAIQGLTAQINQKVADAKHQDEQSRQRIQKAIEEARISGDQRAKELHQAALERFEEDRARKYQQGCENMESGASKDTAADFESAKRIFLELGDYRDSAERAQKCAETAEEIYERERRKNAARIAAAEAAAKKKKIVTTVVVLVALLVAAAGLVAKFVIIPDAQYKAAMEMAQNGQYDEAIAAFKALGEYKDAEAQAKNTQYAKGEAMMAAGDYDGATTAYQAAGNYSDASTKAKEAQYQKGERVLVEQNNEAAAQAFASAVGYQDALKRSYQIRYQNLSEGKIATGGWKTVGLKSDGTVAATGSDGFSQCDVSGWQDIVAVSAGGYHTVGLKSDGTVAAMGMNEYGQCNVSGWQDIVAVSAGGYHTVGLKSDGMVVTTGRNEDGQCDVSDWRDIIAVSAGGYHTVGLKSDGTVVATGENDSGKCDVSDWTDIVAVSAGDWHTVGLKSDGTVVATGLNEDGQCNVSGWRDIVAVSAGRWHTVGLKSDGTVVAMGGKGSSQCNVSGWTDIVSIAAGGYHTVGLKSDGTVVATGDNGSGECDVSDWTDIGGRRTLQ